MFQNFKLKGLEANIWKIYLFRALYGFFLSVPIIVLFWQQNGLSMFQVTVLQSLFSVAVIGLEVPSGYFADLYGRRNTLLTASIFATLGITAYSLGQGFLDFLIGEVLWAVGVSLISGADSAMFYDTLVEQGRESEYQSLWGKSSSYYMLSAAVAAVAGGLIADINLRWALFAQIPIFALMVPVAYSMKEPEHYKDVSEEESKAMKAVVKDVFQRKDLRNIVLYGAFIYAALKTAFWFYQPYFELTGLDIATFGFIFAGFNVVSAASSRYADFIEDQLGRKLSLVMLLVLVVVSLSIMSSIIMTFSFVIIFIQQFVRGFSKPIISDYINQLIDSENRSTILSTHSLIGRAIQAASLPLFGVISDTYTITWALSILGLTVFFAGAVLLAIMYLEDLTY